MVIHSALGVVQNNHHELLKVLATHEQPTSGQ